MAIGVVGWLDVVGCKTYGLFINGARSVSGRGSIHLLGGKGLSDLSRHVERCVLVSVVEDSWRQLGMKKDSVVVESSRVVGCGKKNGRGEVVGGERAL